MNIERIRPRGNRAPFWKVFDPGNAQELVDAVLGLKDGDGEDIELEVEGCGPPWTFRTRREVLCWAEGYLAGWRREQQYESLIGAFESVLMKAKASGATRSSVLSDRETIDGYLAGCGSREVQERCAGLVMGVVEMLG